MYKRKINQNKLGYIKYFSYLASVRFKLYD